VVVVVVVVAVVVVVVQNVAAFKSVMYFTQKRAPETKKGKFLFLL